MTDRETMMKNIQARHFAMLESQLFLNTNPNNKTALAYFRRQQAAYNMAIKEFEQKYGPLTAHEQSNNEHWDWIKGPWPWEMEA